MEKRTFNILKEYIISLDYLDPNKISKETEVEKDLGVTGDDAIDFIEDYSSIFNVDVSNFDFNKYFHSEGIDFKWFLGRSNKDPYKREKLTLEDLANAIDKGKLE